MMNIFPDKGDSLYIVSIQKKRKQSTTLQIYPPKKLDIQFHTQGFFPLLYPRVMVVCLITSDPTLPQVIQILHSLQFRVVWKFCTDFLVLDDNQANPKKMGTSFFFLI